MTKAELIANVAEKAEISKKEAEKVIAATIDSIKEALVKGDKLGIVGFGTFEIRDRASRKGRNPKTGETLDIPASKAPAFKASKTLKEAVNAA